MFTTKPINVDYEAIAAICGLPVNKDYLDKAPEEDEGRPDYEHGIILVRRADEELLVSVASSSGDDVVLEDYEAKDLADAILKASADCKKMKKARIKWCLAKFKNIKDPEVVPQGKEVGRTYEFGDYFISLTIQNTDKGRARLCCIMKDCDIDTLVMKHSTDLTLSEEVAAAELKAYLIDKENRKEVK